MNWLRIIGGVTCLGLGGVIAAELMADIRPASSFVAAAPAATTKAEEPSAAAPNILAVSVQAIEERPVFSPSRRPVTVSSAAPMPQIETTVKPFTRKLTGIVVEPSLRAAVFAGDGSRSVVVKEGEPIDGWFLERVTPVSVTMSAAGTSQEIALIKNKTSAYQSESKPPMPSFISPLLQVPPPSMATREPLSPLVPSAVRPVR